MNQGYPRDGGNGGGRRRKSARQRAGRRSQKPQRQFPVVKSTMKRSVFAKPKLSKAPIRITSKFRKEPIIGMEFIYALVGIATLILLGGGGHVFAQGFALLLTGILLLRCPPQASLGLWFNVGTLVFLLGGLMGFLPGGLGLQSGWREIGTGVHQLDLPFTSTIRPMQSVEAFLMLVAILCWFYSLSQIRLNASSRKWILFWVSVFCLCIGAAACFGFKYGWNYPGSSLGGPFSFFSEPRQMGFLLLVCGVFAFGFGFESLTHRSGLYLIGLPAAAGCFIALVLGKHFTALLLFFVGMGLYCGLRIFGADLKLRLRLLAVISLYSVVIFTLCLNGGLLDLAQQIRLPIKAWQMFIETPLTGIGLGNFPIVMVHYYETWQSGIPSVDYPNDFMWVACTMGIVGLLGFLAMWVGVVRGLEFSKIARLGSLRLVTILACFIYLLIGFTGEGRQALALVYFALLMLALSYPLGDRFKGRMPSWLWRGCGFIFLITGSVWMLGGLARLPVHSQLIAEARELQYGKAQLEEDLYQSLNSLNRLIELEPVYWYWYHERAKLMLEMRENAKAELDFNRARFLEPHLTGPVFLEGEAWFGHKGIKAENAWREALKRAGRDAPGLFERMVQGGNTSNKAPVLLRLSREDPRYGVIYLEQLEKAAFLQELNQYLKVDPALEQFNREQRTRIVLSWVRHGENDEPARYMEQYASSLNYAWYLQSYIYQNGARFEEALSLLRSGLTVPDLPEPEVEPSKIALLEREIASKPRNYEVGLQLISIHLAQEAYEEGIFLTQRLLEYSDAPPEILYWQAEFYSRKGNAVESWLSFEAYAQTALNLQKQ